MHCFAIFFAFNFTLFETKQKPKRKYLFECIKTADCIKRHRCRTHINIFLGYFCSKNSISLCLKPPKQASSCERNKPLTNGKKASKTKCTHLPRHWAHKSHNNKKRAAQSWFQVVVFICFVHIFPCMLLLLVLDAGW